MKKDGLVNKNWEVVAVTKVKEKWWNRRSERKFSMERKGKGELGMSLGGAKLWSQAPWCGPSCRCEKDVFRSSGLDQLKAKKGWTPDLKSASRIWRRDERSEFWIKYMTEYQVQEGGNPPLWLLFIKHFPCAQTLFGGYLNKSSQ